ncbi:peptide deformylase [Elioraea thermophila]|uniref:peptide deformylase n=1 Tax=Elioraea thermophila TaxID=2185104 RepID=UPI000DF273FB|nr:peptide deformylase [Elioraea thermophila]
MAILKIARMGHPILLARADPVPDPSAPEVRRLVADMIDTLLDADAAGLAAPQVHVPLRLFVFRCRAERLGADPDDRPTGPDVEVVINPELEPIGSEMETAWEGCLSIPGLRGAVPRHLRIRYRGQTLEGEAFERTVSGFHARVVQHEVDHLDGILYPMRMEDFALFGFTEELARAAHRSIGAPHGGGRDG